MIKQKKHQRKKGLFDLSSGHITSLRGYEGRNSNNWSHYICRQEPKETNDMKFLLACCSVSIVHSDTVGPSLGCVLPPIVFMKQ